MEKTTIKNRKKQNVVVIVEQSTPQNGLAFVMHGLGGTKDRPQIIAITEVLKQNKYSVVRFDTTNTFGESDGNYEDATTTNYYEDLEDVINWASKQSWYQEPFVLFGHSLGGISTALFTEKHPDKVRALAPLSTVVSGNFSIKTHNEEHLKQWKKEGFREEISSSGILKSRFNNLKFLWIQNTKKVLLWWRF